MYTDRDKDAIHADMLDSSRNDVDKREGSIVHDMLMPPAEGIELLGFALEAILENGFIDTAQAEYIDKRANELGVYRKQSQWSVGAVTFAGRNGAEIPVGTEIIADSGGQSIALRTTTYAVIPEEGVIDVATSAAEGGSAGNIPQDSLLICADIPDVIVSNLAAFTGGIDEETDDDLKARYLLKVRKPITSGNIYHYELWAREVDGISQARVIPLWQGAGTVKVIAINKDGRAPTPEQLTAVAAHIEEQRPIGADVTVVAITEIPVNVSATLSLAGDLTPADVQDAVEASIAEYLAEADGTVRYSQIARALLRTEGVTDYSGLLLNGSTDNIEIDVHDVAVVGQVTLI